MNNRSGLTKKYTKKIFTVLAVALFFVALPVLTASAASPYESAPVVAGTCTAGGVFGDVLCGLTIGLQSLTLGLIYAIGHLFSVILSGITSAAVWMIKDLGVDIVTHEAVSIGFGISLKVANVIFVVAIIAIAFSTILRWKEYEAKKLLSKLIIVALLVNFSLLAAGVLLDISNMFTVYFMTGDKVSSERIGNALSPQLFSIPVVYGGGKFQSDDDIFKNLKANYSPLMDNMDGSIGAWDSKVARWRGTKELVIYDFGYGRGQAARDRFEKDLNERNPRLLEQLRANSSRTGEYVGNETDVSVIWDEFLGLLPKVIFSVFMTFVAMLTMVAVFLMALVRNLWVVVLLIVMPVAWAMRALPKFEQYWEKWWEKFLNWGVIYLPTLSFFLYIATETAIQIRGGGKLGIPAGTKTIDFLGIATNGGTGPTTLESVVITLIIIGIMIAGLKIAQAMGFAAAGAIAGLAGKSGKKFAGGLMKVGLGTGALAGKVGLGLGAGLIGSTFRAIKPKSETKTETDAMGVTTTTKTTEGRGKSAAGGFASGWKTFAGANLYGRATGAISEGMAGLSFLPGFGAGAQFFGKLSAAQSLAVDGAVKETDGLSPAALRAWIGAAAHRGAEYQAAAMGLADKNHMHDAIPHESLKKFADSVAAMNPGAERDKIDVLKAFAAHNPEHAEDVLGSKAGVDRFAETVRGADTAAVQSWTEEIYEKARKHMSTSQRRAWAGRDGGAQNKVLAEELKGLEGALDKLPDNIAADIRKALLKDGHKDQALMKQVEGHLEKINGNKVLKKEINTVDGALKSLNAALAIARNTNLRTKSKSEHPVHGDVNYTLGALLKKLAGAAFQGGKAGAASKPKASSGGGHAPSH